MNQDELKQEISERKVKRLYVFDSDDYFLKKTYIERLSKALNIGVKKYFYMSFKEFLEQIPILSAGDLFGETSIKHVKLNFELNQLIDINPSNDIVILDPIKCSNELKSDFIVHFRRLTSQEIISFLKKKIRAKYIDGLIELISKNEFYSNATALYLLTEKLILSENQAEIDFLQKDLLNLEAVDAIVNRNFEQFSSFVDKYSDHPLVLIGTLSTVFFNAFLEMYGVLDTSKPYYKRIISKLSQEKLENLITILYDLDKLYKSTNVLNLLPLKLKIFNWMVQK